MKIGKLLQLISITVVGSLFLVGCAMQPQMAQPNQLIAPTPIKGNTGLYLCPYTQDGVLAEWTDKAMNVGASASIGSAVGAYAGQKALSFIPFVGGYLGEAAGNSAGRAIALSAIGGEEFIKKSSDLSFNNLDDLSVFMYVNYSTNEHYTGALKATMEIYPDLKKSYHAALQKAARR